MREWRSNNSHIHGPRPAGLEVSLGDYERMFSRLVPPCPLARANIAVDDIVAAEWQQAHAAPTRQLPGAF